MNKVPRILGGTGRHSHHYGHRFGAYPVASCDARREARTPMRLECGTKDEMAPTYSSCLLGLGRESRQHRAWLVAVVTNFP